ncbi:MAG: protein-tyrosine-phosphatase [Flavobacteriales bacterium]
MERHQILKNVALAITESIAQFGEARLNFICTHNSRRSQFSQVWGHMLAHQYGLPVTSFSGGVEVTACNERTIASLERLGMQVDAEGEGNPRYSVVYEGSPVAVLFSKVFDDAANPSERAIALMTCDHADENCPFIPSAWKRLPLRYEDPKRYDDTERESSAYDETRDLIREELDQIFAMVKTAISEG